MSYQVLELDPAKRVLDKAAARDRDAERLRSGEVSCAQLGRENNFFSSLDLSSFEIAAIGGRPLVR
jgi:hypothetical protein